MKPIPFGSFSTAWRSRPSEDSSEASEETFLPSSSSVWKLVSTPATEVRLIRSIVPEAVAPGTWLQLRVLPVKIETTCDEVRLLRALALFVTTQIPYLAIG